MTVFQMVVWIVAIACTARLVGIYLTRRERHVAVDDSPLAVEVDELRARIEVLEKIVTDSGYQLRRELADLEHH